MVTAIIDESAKSILKEAIPASGTTLVNSLEETLVGGYEKVVVDATNIVPENIKKDVEILGVIGQYSAEE